MRGVLYLLGSIGIFLGLNQLGILSAITDPDTQLLIALSTIFIGSFLVFYVSNASHIPTFVTAILIGMAASPLLIPLTASGNVLQIVVGISATLILFSGGLEMPFERFRKIALVVLLLATIGVLLSTVFFGYTLFGIAEFLPSLEMSFGIALLLGAIVASTDPTVLIPMMKQLRFKRVKMKDIIIGESAATDVTGALLAVLLLEIITNKGTGVAQEELFRAVFSAGTAWELLGHGVLGIVFGVLGAGMLVALARLKTQDDKEYDVDAAFFLFVPIIIYTLANAVGGSGFLAAFIAGLLFQTTQYLHETERFFNHIIDGFVKPAVFILLGAIVPVSSLLSYAPAGILAGIVFILIIRPVVVQLSLLPAQFTKFKLHTAEIFGLSAIRETGAVPAVLIISMMSVPGVGSEAFLAIGLWIIIMTVLIPPAITPWIFEKLGIAERMPEKVGAKICDQEESFVILASRGGSYARRLPGVTEWALEHNIHRICLLLCLEDKYSKDKLAGKIEQAKAHFEKIKLNKAEDGQKIDFFVVSTDGFLHDALKSIPSETCHAVAVFVGKKMLDFHLEEIQELGIPLYFTD